MGAALPPDRHRPKGRLLPQQGLTVFNAQNCGIHQSGITVLCFRNDGSESSGILNIARPYAVGRKNFLFHDTVKGARASSIIYSLVETAKLNNLNIYAYLETVLLYMPDYKNEPEGIEELMPWSDMIQQRCQIKSKR